VQIPYEPRAMRAGAELIGDLLGLVTFFLEAIGIVSELGLCTKVLQLFA